MIEEGCDLKKIKLAQGIPLVMAPNTRHALAITSSNFYGNPSKKFKLIGITGTKGKTTTTFMIKDILEKAGKKVGLIVIILDALKCFMAILLNLLIYKLFFTKLGNMQFSICAMITGFLVAVGHCFPVWSKFNGGKAVATIAGFIATINPIVFLMSFVVFFSVYLLSKYVSLASMACSIFGTILCWIPFILGSTYFPGLTFGIDYTIAVPLAFTLTTTLLVYRHKANIIRMMHGNENKSYLFKKKN